jgi:hypothetical protein
MHNSRGKRKVDDFQEPVSQAAACSSNSGKQKVDSIQEVAIELQRVYGKDNYQLADQLAIARNQWNKRNDFCTDFQHSALGILKNQQVFKLVLDAHNANSYVCQESGFLLPTVPGKIYGSDKITGTFGFDIDSPELCRKHEIEARINVDASIRKRKQLGKFLEKSTFGLEGELEWYAGENQRYLMENYAGPSTRSKNLPLASISAHMHTEQLALPIPIIPMNNPYFYIGLGISSAFIVFFRGVFLQPVEFQTFDSSSSYIEFG